MLEIYQLKNPCMCYLRSVESNEISSHPFCRCFRYPLIPPEVCKGGLVCDCSVVKERNEFLLSSTSVYCEIFRKDLPRTNTIETSSRLFFPILNFIMAFLDLRFLLIFSECDFSCHFHFTEFTKKKNLFHSYLHSSTSQ